MSTEENKKIFNIVLDSDEVIDLNKITDASRIINKIMDNHEDILDDCDELDIYSNEKGEIEGE
jgi:ribosome maturation factor RimP